MIRRRFILAFALVALTSACDDSVAPPTIFGTYQLQTVDGKTLPTVLLDEDGYVFTAEDATYTLREDGTFTNSLTWKETYGGWTHDFTHSFEGTYSIADDLVIFVWPAEDNRWTGTLTGRELSVTEHGNTWLYRK